MPGEELLVWALPHLTSLPDRGRVARTCKALEFSEQRGSFWADAMAKLCPPPRRWAGRVSGARAKRFAVSLRTGLCVHCRSVRPAAPHPLFPVHLCSRCAALKRYELCSHEFAVRQCQMAQEPPLLSALDHSLGCLPECYTTLYLRLCFTDVFGCRFPVRGQTSSCHTQLRFYFVRDVLDFKSCVQTPAQAEADARRRAAIHSRLPLLTAPYRRQVSLRVGAAGSPDEIDAMLLRCGSLDGRRQLLEWHQAYVALPGAGPGDTVPVSPPPVWYCARCRRQPAPGERVAYTPCCGQQLFHLPCLLRQANLQQPPWECPGCRRTLSREAFVAGVEAALRPAGPVEPPTKKKKKTGG